MKLEELVALNCEEITSLYASREVSPVDVMHCTLAQIEKVNPTIGALFSIRAQEAMDQARASESRWSKGAGLGPLDGIPVSIKDSIALKGWPWRHGLRANRNLPDSTFTAPPAARLLEAGALIFAKTVMPDCGLMASGVSSLHSPARNPWGMQYNTGGSSAGAGASLAAGIGVMSVGSDIAGSVRLPASHCGLIALKPSFGRIPHLAPDVMRTAGPMARNVVDAARLFEVLRLPDARDVWSLAPDNKKRLQLSESMKFKRLRIGLLTDLGYGMPLEAPVRAAVQAVAAAFAERGAVVEYLEKPYDHDAMEPIDRAMQVRGWAEIQGLAPELRKEVWPAVYRWAQAASSCTAQQYLSALSDIARDRARMQQLTERFDYLLTPVMPMVNFAFDASGADEAMPLRHAQFTAPFNQTGQPAVSVHHSFDDRGLPIGVQIVGQRFNDLGVLKMAYCVEQWRSNAIAWPLEPLT